MNLSEAVQNTPLYCVIADRYSDKGETYIKEMYLLVHAKGFWPTDTPGEDITRPLENTAHVLAGFGQ